MDEDNPVQFKLPQDVRQFFAGGKLLPFASKGVLWAKEWQSRLA